ncbi:hypothetical protein QR680_002562 [Steinernema hermaphroditum]|uniref:RING-type domain-containing protein n=1 Tax=Steinernema hermaphroditum TaxID=289476 RepID=A0AA39H424_9BILA|nr:hypothetical protein QR680_002562 [Steinernema hermaphroditum]
MEDDRKAKPNDAPQNEEPLAQEQQAEAKDASVENNDENADARISFQAPAEERSSAAPASSDPAGVDIGRIHEIRPENVNQNLVADFAPPALEDSGAEGMDEAEDMANSPPSSPDAAANEDRVDMIGASSDRNAAKGSPYNKQNSGNDFEEHWGPDPAPRIAAAQAFRQPYANFNAPPRPIRSLIVDYNNEPHDNRRPLQNNPPRLASLASMAIPNHLSSLSVRVDNHVPMDPNPASGPGPSGRAPPRSFYGTRYAPYTNPPVPPHPTFPAPFGSAPAPPSPLLLGTLPPSNFHRFPFFDFSSNNSYSSSSNSMFASHFPPAHQRPTPLIPPNPTAPRPGGPQPLPAGPNNAGPSAQANNAQPPNNNTNNNNRPSPNSRRHVPLRDLYPRAYFMPPTSVGNLFSLTDTAVQSVALNSLIRQIADNVECPNCHEIMRDPVSLSPCNHSICSNCSRQYTSQQRTANPVCLQCAVAIRTIARNPVLDNIAQAFDSYTRSVSNNAPQLSVNQQRGARNVWSRQTYFDVTKGDFAVMEQNMSEDKKDIYEEVELLKMFTKLSVATILKLKSQLAVTEKDISEQLTCNTYHKRKAEQAKLVKEMKSSACELLKMNNDVAEKWLEFSNYLHSYCERVIEQNKEVNELLQNAQEFETVRDQNIIPDYLKENDKESIESPVLEKTREDVPKKKLTPTSRLAEAEAAYEEVKRRNELSEKRNETHKKEVMADYEKFYEQFKNSLR